MNRQDCTSRALKRVNQPGLGKGFVNLALIKDLDRSGFIDGLYKR